MLYVYSKLVRGKLTLLRCGSKRSLPQAQAHHFIGYSFSFCIEIHLSLAGLVWKVLQSKVLIPNLKLFYVLLGCPLKFWVETEIYIYILGVKDMVEAILTLQKGLFYQLNCLIRTLSCFQLQISVCVILLWVFSSIFDGSGYSGCFFSFLQSVLSIPLSLNYVSSQQPCWTKLLNLYKECMC